MKISQSRKAKQILQSKSPINGEYLSWLILFYDLFYNYVDMLFAVGNGPTLFPRDVQSKVNSNFKIQAITHKNYVMVLLFSLE